MNRAHAYTSGRTILPLANTELRREPATGAQPPENLGTTPPAKKVKQAPRPTYPRLVAKILPLGVSAKEFLLFWYRHSQSFQ